MLDPSVTSNPEGLYSDLYTAEGDACEEAVDLPAISYLYAMSNPWPVCCQHGSAPVPDRCYLIVPGSRQVLGSQLVFLE